MTPISFIFRGIIFGVILASGPRVFGATEIPQGLCVHYVRSLASSRTHFPDLKTGVTYRGFLASLSALPATPEVEAEAALAGIEKWNLRIYIVASLEEARAHHDRVSENPARAGVYVLGEAPSVPAEGSGEDGKARVLEEWRAAFKALAGNGVYFFGNDGLRRLDSTFVSRHLNPDELLFSADKHVGAFLAQPGWTKSQFSGVLSVYKLIENSSKSLREVRRFLLLLLSKGYSVRFNSDFERVLKGLREMERGQANLYADETRIEETRRFLTSGRGYTIELWNPEGTEMLSAVVAQRRAFDFSGEGVFYPTGKALAELKAKDPDLAPKKYAGIDFAKVIDWIFLRRYADAGFELMDVGMVTDFTALMGADFWSVANYERARALMPREHGLNTGSLLISNAGLRKRLHGILTAPKGLDHSKLAAIEHELPPELLQPQRDYSGSSIYRIYANDPLVKAGQARREK